MSENMKLSKSFFCSIICFGLLASFGESSRAGTCVFPNKPSVVLNCLDPNASPGMLPSYAPAIYTPAAFPDTAAVSNGTSCAGLTSKGIYGANGSPLIFIRAIIQSPLKD